MGFQTTVVVNNDMLHDIRQNAQEFVDELCRVAGTGGAGYDDKPIELRHGAKVITIEPSHYSAVVVVGDRTGKVLAPILAMDTSPNDPDVAEKSLRALADKLGFRVVKTRVKKSKKRRAKKTSSKGA